MMKYLFIALAIVFVISPLLWLRQSPGQARITAFRNRALQLGLKVQIVPPADAAPDDRSPDAVRYLRPLQVDDTGHVAALSAHWTLLRSARRGHVSPFEGWRWHRDDAPAHLHEALGRCLAVLPEAVVALRADEQGLSAYWHETGNVRQVEVLAAALGELFPVLLAPVRAIPPAPRPLTRRDPHL
ncbi:MAG: hypothetical protein M0R02_13525 [Bacteroidales bacterium]|nr:hypothetical protein [Bacteroidales bacterium]